MWDYRILVAAIAAGAAITAVNSCGGDPPVPHIEISGKPPAEGAELAARAICTRDARCGRPSVSCTGSGAAGGSGSDAGSTTHSCTATIRPVPFDDCHADASGDIAELLACPMLTAADIDTLETCFNILAALKCVTQAEADAQARASEAGNPPMRDVPPACAILLQPPPGC